MEGSALHPSPLPGHGPERLPRHLYVAAALLPRDGFAALARRERARLLRSLERPAGGDFRAALALRLAALERLLVREGFDPAGFDAPPAHRDETATGYCPVCRAEFTAGPARCSDCDTPLSPFDFT